MRTEEERLTDVNTHFLWSVHVLEYVQAFNSRIANGSISSKVKLRLAKVAAKPSKTQELIPFLMIVTVLILILLNT